MHTERSNGQVEPTGWPESGLEDDIRPRMFACADEREPFALATIVAADGGPRPVGAQMVVSRTGHWGFLSGGCIEDDVATNAREVIADGEPRRLVYGTGSPFVDIRLPCGGSIEVAIERVEAGDEALSDLRALTLARQPACWLSDGRTRRCVPQGQSTAHLPHSITRRYLPVPQMVVVGSDPFALAIAGLAQMTGWDTVLLAPFGPAQLPPFGVPCDRRPLEVALAALKLDPWTAVAVATHDLAVDQEALVPALRSDSFYVGVLGSRRKLAARRDGLRQAGLSDLDIERLSAPMGLEIGAQSAWEVAFAVMAEIIDARRLGDQDTALDHVAA